MSEDAKTSYADFQPGLIEGDGPEHALWRAVAAQEWQQRCFAVRILESQLAGHRGLRARWDLRPLAGSKQPSATGV